MKYFFLAALALVITAIALLLSPDPGAAPALPLEHGQRDDTPTPTQTTAPEATHANTGMQPSPGTPTRNHSSAEPFDRIDARTIELAGKYRVTGNGTHEDPYRVTWELLMSASQSIDASNGKLTPPKWIALLDGMWIEISAYYSTVVRKESVDELLLTFNRWDGCCIGLPPTPFDSIEMKLTSPMRMTGLHLTRYGTFRGQLHVSPIAAAGFLLGFYQLSDANMQ